MIKSPKEKFQQSQVRTSQWAQIVSNPLFDEACDVALLEMQSSLLMGVSFETAAMSYHEILGATIFIRKLKTLHEITQEPKEPTRQGLNYQAGV